MIPARRWRKAATFQPPGGRRFGQLSRRRFGLGRSVARRLSIATMAWHTVSRIRMPTPSSIKSVWVWEGRPDRGQGQAQRPGRPRRLGGCWRCELRCQGHGQPPGVPRRRGAWTSAAGEVTASGKRRQSRTCSIRDHPVSRVRREYQAPGAQSSPACSVAPRSAASGASRKRPRPSVLRAARR
jgi:hypothetical protein